MKTPVFNFLYNSKRIKTKERGYMYDCIIKLQKPNTMNID